MSESAMPSSERSLFLDGIDYFNRGEFFECHEVWEALWNQCAEGDRRFFQGLIQAAVALHHACQQNVVGARKLYRAAREKLLAYPAHYQGLDVTRFLKDLTACLAPVLGGDGAAVDTGRLPRIELEL